MEYGAIDLHKRRSQVRIVREDGTVVLERRIDTSRADLEQVFSRPVLPVLVESSTESEWVAQRLEELGHPVIVADPNYVAMYGSRSRRVKTDKRDAAALAEACRTGTSRRAHRASAAARDLRRRLRVRSQLVRQRSGLISLLRALLRQEGLRLASGSADGVVTRLDRLTLPPALAAALAPLRTMLVQWTTTLAVADAALHEQATHDPVTQHLMSAPGVGPVVALTFQAVLDTPARFGGDAARASAFIGVVPREDSSGERRQKGAITKAGPRELRALLVQAGWVIWRGKTPAGAALRGWAHALAARRGGGLRWSRSRGGSVACSLRSGVRARNSIRRCGRAHKRPRTGRRSQQPDPGARSVSWPPVSAVSEMAPRVPRLSSCAATDLADRNATRRLTELAACDSAPGDGCRTSRKTKPDCGNVEIPQTGIPTFPQSFFDK